MRKIVQRLILSVLALVGGMGCATQGTDAHGLALPSNTRHLHISTSSGTISFTRPNGWRIIQLNQPDNATLVIGFVGNLNREFTFGRQPHISVSWQSHQASRRVSQAVLHSNYLREMRTHLGKDDGMFGFDAGNFPLNGVSTVSGRAVDIRFYAGAPFLDIIALIPERGGVAEVTLQATTLQDIVKSYDTYIKVVKSYHFE